MVYNYAFIERDTMISGNELIEEARTVISPYFLNASKITDDQILSLCKIVLDELNYITPITNYDLCTAPRSWKSAILVGLHVFVLLAAQTALGLKEFNYSDNGLSLQLNRIQNLDIPLKMYRPIFESMAWNIKKSLIFKNIYALGYPRYQMAVSSFLRVLFGAFFRG